MLLANRYFPTLLVVLMAVFNDGAMIALSKDRVTPSRTPNRWNLPVIFGEGDQCTSFAIELTTLGALLLKLISKPLYKFELWR